MTHEICDACETVAHCMQHGCIPLQPVQPDWKDRLIAQHEEMIVWQAKRIADLTAQQEPVAWLVVSEYIGGKRLDIQWNVDADVMAFALGRLDLYTRPQREPLTDEQITKCWGKVEGTRHGYVPFARAIEAAHGIKE